MSGSFDVAHPYTKISTRRSLLSPIRDCFIREIGMNGVLGGARSRTRDSASLTCPGSTEKEGSFIDETVVLEELGRGNHFGSVVKS